MDGFVGKWHMVDTENFDKYLSELGVGFTTREVAKHTKPTQEISVEDGWTTIKTASTFKTVEIKFKLEEEFDEHTADDKTIKSIVHKESDTKFVHTQHREHESTITRELVGDEYIMTLEYNKVVAVRKYKRTK